MGATGSTDPDDAVLAEIERAAVDLARLAGAEIQGWLGRTMSVRYKTGADDAASLRDPVSEVDHRCETMIRARLDELFPSHGVLGEELDEKPGEPGGYLWAVDPIDGTTNFVNGFPLFSAAIGVLHGGRPVVGALWCSTSHALRPGVYHARRGGRLSFDSEVLDRPANADVRGRLAGEPYASPGPDHGLDMRKTGSAAIECAFVAAGLLSVARFERPNVWDVAGGLALVEAAGLAIHAGGPRGWRPFTGFGPDHGDADIRSWRQPLVIGDAAAAARMIAAQEGGRPA